jgi:hypothetical protein
LAICARVFSRAQIAKKTQILIDKLNSGQKITQKEMKDLEILKKRALEKEVDKRIYFLGKVTRQKLFFELAKLIIFPKPLSVSALTQ